MHKLIIDTSNSIKFFKHGFNTDTWDSSTARLFDSVDLNIKRDDPIEERIVRIHTFNSENCFKDFNARFLVRNNYNYDVNFESYDIRTGFFMKKSSTSSTNKKANVDENNQPRLSKIKAQLSNTRLGSFISRKLSDHALQNLQSELVISEFVYTVRSGEKDINFLGPLSENVIVHLLKMKRLADVEKIFKLYGTDVVYGGYKSISIEIRKVTVRASVPVDRSLLYDYGLACLNNEDTANEPLTIRDRHSSKRHDVTIDCVEYATLQTDDFYKITSIKTVDLQSVVGFFITRPGQGDVARRLGFDDNRLQQNYSKYLRVFSRLKQKDDAHKHELLEHVTCEIADKSQIHPDAYENFNRLWNEVIKFPKVLGTAPIDIYYKENELDCLARLAQDDYLVNFRKKLIEKIIILVHFYGKIHRFIELLQNF